MSITVIYGIPNCDTVKKARAWLTGQGVAHTFHDYARLGLPDGALDRWTDAAGWERLLNRKGTSWRKLDAAVQGSVVDETTAKAVMREHLSTIKRPVVEWDDGRITVGFDAAAWGAR